MSKRIITAFVLLTVTSCKFKAPEEERGDAAQPASAEGGNTAPQLPPRVEVSGKDNADSFSLDSKVAADAIQGQMDEAVNASGSVDEFSSSGGSALALNDVSFDKSRTCTEDAAAKSATEVSKLAVMIDKTFAFFGRQTAIKVNGSEDRTSKWTKEGDVVKCNGKSIKRPDNLKGVVMDSNFTRSLSKSIASKDAGAGKNMGPGAGGIIGVLLGQMFQESSSSESKGVRKISWTADDFANGVRTEKHSIETDVKKKVTKKVNDKDLSYEASLKTKDGEPVVVEVVRNGASKGLFGLPSFASIVPESKTIQSGTLIALRKDGSRIESHFDKVKYEFKKSGCMPTAGKLTGEIYPSAGAASPTPTAAPTGTPTKGADPAATPTAAPTAGPKKFAVDFSVQPVVIEFSDGQKEPFLPMGCDFEDISNGVK